MSSIGSGKLPWWIGFLGPSATMAYASAEVTWQEHDRKSRKAAAAETTARSSRLHPILPKAIHEARSEALELLLQIKEASSDTEALSKLVSSIDWGSLNATDTAQILARLKPTKIPTLDLRKANLELLDAAEFPTHLKELKISNLRGSEIEVILSLNPNLERLYIDHNTLSLSLTGIRHEKLERLCLTSCIGLFKLPTLSNFPALKYLCLDSSQVREIEDFNGHATLRAVEITDCSAIRRLPNFSNLDQLTSVEIACRALEEGPLFENCPRLSTTRFRQCSSLIEGARIDNCPELSGVTYVDCEGLG